MFFRFPPDARWNADHAAVEFGIGIGEYEGVVRVSDASSNSWSRKPQHLNAASKHTTCTRHGSNSSRNGRFAAGSWPTMGMSRSLVAICGKGKSRRTIHAPSAIVRPLHESRTA